MSKKGIVFQAVTNVELSAVDKECVAAALEMASRTLERCKQTLREQARQASRTRARRRPRVYRRSRLALASKRRDVNRETHTLVATQEFPVPGPHALVRRNALCEDPC